MSSKAKVSKSEPMAVPSDPAEAGGFYDRVLAMLEAGLIEITIRPTTPTRRAAVGLERHEDGLREFIRDRVTLAPKMSVTSQELVAGYTQWTREMGRPPVGPRAVMVALEPIMRSEHGVPQRRNIVRNGKQVRGYPGVCMFVPPSNGDGEEDQ